MMKYNLDRFLKAQAADYDTALREIYLGSKESHWMWYIFPQLLGLGRSETSRFYAIESEEEARAYYEHPILGDRLKEITVAFLNIEGKSAQEILGSPDHYKMKSCMTLFDLVQDETDLFRNVLVKYYEGKISHRTRELLTKY